MTIKKPFTTSILQGLTICLIIFSANTFAIAQLLCDEFTPLGRELIKKTEQANFTEGEALLREFESLDYQNDPVLAAEQKFVAAYLYTFKNSDQYSYDLFSEAALMYERLGNQSMVYLCEAFQLRNIYNMTRWEETLRVGHKLLATIPLAEAEPRAVVHAVLSYEYSGHNMDFDKATYHGNKAISFFTKHHNSRRLISLYGVRASCYNNKGDYETALIFIDSAQVQAELINNRLDLAFLKIRKGRSHFTAGNDKAGRASLLEAADYFKQQSGSNGELDLIYGLMSRNYADNGNYKIAFEYLKEWTKTSALRRFEENDRATNDLMVKYETEKKERQLEIQALSIASSQQKFKTLLILASGVLIILTLSFLLFYNKYKNKRKQELRKKELQFQKNLLDTTIATQEAERKRISQDLHDGIGQQLSGLKFSLEQYGMNSPSKTQVAKFISVLKDATTEVRNISHNMMPRSIQNLGLTAALSDMLEKSFEGSSVIVNFETMGDDKKLLESTALGIYRIAQELINNIIKHSNATEIDLDLSINSKRLLLMLEENGKGFTLVQNKIRGHGLSNIQTRAQVLDGKINFEKKITGGMLTTLTVPINA